MFLKMFTTLPLDDRREHGLGRDLEHPGEHHELGEAQRAFRFRCARRPSAASHGLGQLSLREAGVAPAHRNDRGGGVVPTLKGLRVKS